MSTSKPKVVFAGLDAMGYCMASHLLASEFPVIGYDVYQPAVLKLVAEGGQSANTPREAAKDVPFFICMVANSVQVKSLLFDETVGAVHAMPINATILMCSTFVPSYIDELRQCLDAIGRDDIRLIDSPLLGGVVSATNGTLSVLASGRDTYLADAESILECLSGRLHKVAGGPGAASRARLIHQIFAGMHIAVASEAMGLAAAAGLNTSAAFEALKDGDGASLMFNMRVPHMLDPSLPAYSAMTSIANDVGIVTSAGREYRFPLPLMSTAEQLYVKAISAGWGKEDDSVLVRLYLPGRENLVEHEAKPLHYSESPSVDVEDIRNLMTCAHLVTMTEAMSFCEHLGIDTDIMFDIVAHSAGASAVFLKAFKGMQKDEWSLKSVPNIVWLQNEVVCATLIKHGSDERQLISCTGACCGQSLHTWVSSLLVLCCIAGTLPSITVGNGAHGRRPIKESLICEGYSVACLF